MQRVQREWRHHRHAARVEHIADPLPLLAQRGELSSRAGQQLQERAVRIPAHLGQPVVATEHLHLHRAEAQLRGQ